jgi:hypothetical protein
MKIRSLFKGFFVNTTNFSKLKLIYTSHSPLESVMYQMNMLFGHT